MRPLMGHNLWSTALQYDCNEPSKRWWYLKSWLWCGSRKMTHFYTDRYRYIYAHILTGFDDGLNVRYKTAITTKESTATPVSEPEILELHLLKWGILEMRQIWGKDWNFTFKHINCECPEIPSRQLDPGVRQGLN